MKMSCLEFKTKNELKMSCLEYKTKEKNEKELS